MKRREKRPALFKSGAIGFAQEMYEAMRLIPALMAWWDEAPEPVKEHVAHLAVMSQKASTPKERRNMLWSSEVWFLIERHQEAWEWVREHGDDWLARDPRNRPTARAALREVERILSGAAVEG